MGVKKWIFGQYFHIDGSLFLNTLISRLHAHFCLQSVLRQNGSHHFCEVKKNNKKQISTNQYFLTSFIRKHHVCRVACLYCFFLLSILHVLFPVCIHASSSPSHWRSVLENNHKLMLFILELLELRTLTCIVFILRFHMHVMGFLYSTSLLNFEVLQVYLSNSVEHHLFMHSLENELTQYLV